MKKMKRTSQDQQTAPEHFKLKWYQKPRWAVFLIPVCLAGAYVLATLAIDSGSLLQYFAAIALIVLAVNRLAHVILWGMGKGRIG